MKGPNIRRQTFVAAAPGTGRADRGRTTNQSTMSASVSKHLSFEALSHAELLQVKQQDPVFDHGTPPAPAASVVF